MPFHKSGLIVGVLLALAVAGQEKKSSLPEGQGKEATERVCANCHELETVTGARRTRIGWQRMVEDMVARGAEASDEDAAAIVAYLTAHYGKVNVNTATASELEKTLGLSVDEAKAIRAYREKSGKISDFEQLKRIPGVSAEKLDAKRPLIAFAL
jgi:competence ComEA-like helix-hairpin-helix protein